MRSYLFMAFLFISLSSLKAQDMDWNLTSIQNNKSSSIIGIGESCHGTSSLNEHRRKLIEQLILSDSVRIIGIEERPQVVNLINNQLINSNDTNRVKEILVKHALWVNKNRELFKLIQFVQKYNSIAEGDKVEFFGITGYYKIELLKNEFPQWYVDSKMHNSIRDILLDSITPSEVSIRLLKKELNLIENNVISKDSIRFYYDLLNFVQGSIYTLTKNRKERYQFHDLAMFRNVNFIAKQFHIATDNKIILWAHNSHIAKKNDAFKRLGKLLDKEYGKSYLAILIDFNTGSFLAYEPTQLEDGDYNYSPKIFNKQIDKDRKEGIITKGLFPIKLNSIGAQYSEQSKLNYSLTVKVGRHADLIVLVGFVKSMLFLDGFELKSW